MHLQEPNILSRAGISKAIIRMITLIAPIHKLLSQINKVGADPDLGGQDMRQLKQALPGKAIWGGFSGPGHFGADTPEKAGKAVEKAIEICGKRGLILGMSVSFHHYWPWENFEAAERAWKRLR